MTENDNFHMEDVKTRLLEMDTDVNVEVFSVRQICYLKLFKRLQNQPESLLSFNPLVFTLLQKSSKNSLKILFMSYNEEVLEELVVELEDKVVLQDSLLLHIHSLLNRPFRLCTGLVDPDLLIQSEEINKILIEKFGESIIFRARNCSRLVSRDTKVATSLMMRRILGFCLTVTPASAWNAVSSKAAQM